MLTTIDDLRRLLQTELPGLATNATAEDIDRAFQCELQALADTGQLKFGPDHNLTGKVLEVRVFSLLREMRIDVSVGPSGLWDAILELPDGTSTRRCVLEVKSGKAAAPGRTELRQLDDWVFELSGEETARKHGLGGGVSGLAIAMQGLCSLPASRHPTPHKGVMVYNGPLGTEFSARPAPWLGANEIEFADKRDFVIMGLSTLLNWHTAIGADAGRRAEFWDLLHDGRGVLREP